MTLTDALQIIGLFGAVVGLYFNYRQLKSNNRQKAAEFVITLNNNFIQNSEMNKIYYQIEYGNFEYDYELHNSEREMPLDSLLVHFESIAKIYLLGNFTLKDLEYIAYRYLRVYQDKSIQAYLNFLDGWYHNRGLKVEPYSDFRKVGAILENEFFDKDKNSQL